MTLPLPAHISDPPIQANFDYISQQFPIELKNLSQAVKDAIAAGGGGGTENVFIQATAPSTPPAKYLWIQTGLGSGTDMTFWVEDGS